MKDDHTWSTMFIDDESPQLEVESDTDSYIGDDGVDEVKINYTKGEIFPLRETTKLNNYTYEKNYENYENYYETQCEEVKKNIGTFDNMQEDHFVIKTCFIKYVKNYLSFIIIFSLFDNKEFDISIQKSLSDLYTKNNNILKYLKNLIEQNIDELMKVESTDIPQELYDNIMEYINKILPLDDTHREKPFLFDNELLDKLFNIKDFNKESIKNDKWNNINDLNLTTLPLSCKRYLQFKIIKEDYLKK